MNIDINKRKQHIRRQKKQKMIMVLAVLITAAILLATHMLMLSFLTLIAGFIVHELWFSDHIYYDVTDDYIYHFANAITIKGNIQHGVLTLSAPLATDISTLILPITLSSGLLGRLIDPSIEVVNDKQSSRQFFERGAQGVRWLNLSVCCASLHNNSKILLRGTGCTLTDGAVTLQGFQHADYRQQPLLIVAPHADDAELAAFSLYHGNPHAHIVTVSAGEVEADVFEKVTGNRELAALLKGRLRAWDSVNAPVAFGVPEEHCVQLGYFCMTLQEMRAAPTQAIASRVIESTDARIFRKFNLMALPTDSDGINSWQNLVTDLVHLLQQWQPAIIATPHPQLDPHPDHLCSTLAILEACKQCNIAPQFLLYANHHQLTDLYPFGPEHTDVPLPPWSSTQSIASGIAAVPLSHTLQIDKVKALSMMHDLNRPFPFKKRMRRYMQRLIGRSQMPYGDDDYFRRAIRQHELFFYTDINGLTALCETP